MFSDLYWTAVSFSQFLSASPTLLAESASRGAWLFVSVACKNKFKFIVEYTLVTCGI
jgi:hypothetical protein